MLSTLLTELAKMTRYDYLQLVGGMILGISYLPQIYKTYKIKKVGDISLPFWATLFMGLCLMEVNAVHLTVLGTISYAITETVNVFLCGVFLFQVVYYTIKNRGKK